MTTDSSQPSPGSDPTGTLASHFPLILRLRDGISKVVIGRDVDGLRFEFGRYVVEQIPTIHLFVACLLSSLHILLSGRPGEAKTLLSKTLRGLLEDDLPKDGTPLPLYSRIAGVPDLLPMDVIGSEIPLNGTLVFRRGPLHARIVHADEINRIPPRTSSAFFEAMGEHSITVHPHVYPLGPLFFLTATLNQHDPGTYPMSEAQLDRFVVCRRLAPVSDEDLARIAICANNEPTFEHKAKLSQLLATIDWLRNHRLAEQEAWLLGRFVCAIRSVVQDASNGEKSWLRPGSMVSPRAFQWLVRLAKALALLHSGGREENMVIAPRLLLPVAADFLRHRIHPA
jgi:MoxR-like ATPase